MKENKEIKNENIEEKVESKEAEYLELAQRIKAEFENYKRRNAEVASVSFQNGVITLVSKLLPALDSFSQAKSNILDEAVLSGIDLIYNQIMNALEAVGVKKIEALGQVFDPNFHNAVLVDNKEEYPDQTILEEYQAPCDTTPHYLCFRSNLSKFCPNYSNSWTKVRRTALLGC